MTREILVTIAGDASKFNTAVDAAGEKGGKFGNVLSGIGMGVGMAGFNLVTDAVHKVIDVFGESDAAFRTEQADLDKLNVALKNNVPGWDGNTAGIQKLIDANIQLGFSGEETTSSLSLLVGVTHDVGEATKLQAAAMDLARLKGVDLATATDTMVKATEGNTKGLKAYGVAVVPVTAAQDALKASTKNATQEQIDAAKAADQAATAAQMLGQVTALAGGQADAYASGPAGRQVVAQDKVGEAMVKVGSIMDKITGAVAPAFADILSGLVDDFMGIVGAVGPTLDAIGTALPGAISTAMGALKPIADVLGKAIPGAADTLSKALAPVMDVISDITGNSDALKGALALLGGVVLAVVVPPFAAWAAATVVALAPIIAIGAAVAGLVLILDKLGVLKWIGEQLSHVGDLAAPLGAIFGRVGDAISGAAATIGGALQPVFDGIGALVAIFGDFFRTGGDVGMILDGLSESFGIPAAASKPLFDAIGQLGGIFSTVFGDIQTIVSSVLGWLSGFLGEVFKGLQALVTGGLGVIKGLWDAFGGNIMAAVKIAFGFIADTIGNVLKVVQGIFDVFAGLFSGNWSKVWTGVQEIFGGIWDQIQTVFRAALNLFPVLLDTAGKIIGGLWGGIWDGIKAVVSGVGSWLGGVVQTMIIDPIAGAFDTVVGFVWGLPGRIADAARGMFDGISQAFRAALNWIADHWNAIHFTFPSMDLGPLGTVGGWTIGLPHIGPFHQGGIVPGTPGQERLALVQAGERITPISQVNADGSEGPTERIVPVGPAASGGKTELHFHFNGPVVTSGATLDEFGRLIAQRLSLAGIG